jgi:hypothetical protein
VRSAAADGRHRAAAAGSAATAALGAVTVAPAPTAMGAGARLEVLEEPDGLKLRVARPVEIGLDRGNSRGEARGLRELPAKTRNLLGQRRRFGARLRVVDDGARVSFTQANARHLQQLRILDMTELMLKQEGGWSIRMFKVTRLLQN